MSKTYHVLGLMSGTSLDGLDIAYCRIWLDKTNTWQFTIINTETIRYSNTLKSKLKNAILLPEEEHKKLHIAYGNWLGEQSKLFIEKHSLEIDFIASHGHTSHHRPEDNITFQLGDGQELATISGKKVICDFRSYDVSIGGQGAPLVPIGDVLLFNEYTFCLNLG